ncbi:acetylxylan esterase [Paenibacillus tarimensis]|uniref:acetylxylan esterase n=1 Tax=Paenibacillus tarimensis TaxID=416012 RepID=UPI001F167FF9|nr:acetylxylan esterase [Paenibacillus tarimensis]MCF2945573.1 acetylxylan esterase [Paenibacillus tarimensis]
MHAISRRIEELHQVRTHSTPPDDLDKFWARTVQEALARPVNSSRTEVPSLFKGMRVWEIAFDGYANTTIHALYMTPAYLEGPYPCLVTFPGYTGGKGEPEHYASWILMGCAVLAVDVRGQGGGTGSMLGSRHGTSKGWITEGILDKDNCYYKAVAVDSLRAVQWMTEQPDIDQSRIGATGASQGGGLSLLVSALHPAISLTNADIPNLCHIDYGVMHSTGSLSEAADFCRRYPDQTAAVLDNLRYFDMLHLGGRIRGPVLMSVGLKDTVCLPEQVFPMYHALASEDKRLDIYPFTGHIVEPAQQRNAVLFVKKHWQL